MAWSKPETEQVRAALRESAPHLADEPIEFMAEGWGIWAFRAGDYVLRFPKMDAEIAEVRRDPQVWRELADRLSLPISVPEILGENGPNDAPYNGHRYVEGVSLIAAVSLLPANERKGRPEVRLSPRFGHDLGAFLRDVQSFPPERAVELGVPLKDGLAQRADLGSFYADVIRLAFPLINCEARTNAERRFEAFLHDPRNFEYEPRLVHHDLDRQNVLIDPETGDLAGVIDWGDAVAGNPSIDLWLPLMDFPALGIGDQLQDCLDAYGPFDRERAQVQVEFIDFLWPFHDILYGLHIGEDDFVEGGIRELNAGAPPDTRCT